MIVYVIYEKGDDFSRKIIENIKANLKNNIYYNKYRIKFYFMLKKKLYPDIFLVVSNNMEFIKKKTNYLTGKNKLIIITDTINYKDTKFLFKITNNIVSSDVSIEKLILKIITVYYKNKLAEKL